MQDRAQNVHVNRVSYDFLTLLVLAIGESIRWQARVNLHELVVRQLLAAGHALMP